MKTTFNLLAILALAVLIGSCSKTGQVTEKQTEKITKKVEKFQRILPSKSIAIGCQTDVFEVSKGAQINYETGAKVVVPENAFVDEDGNPVTGEVKLEFAEINDPASVIASGLPMCIKTAGKTGYFQSGGMFEINAKQEGKKLRLAEGKQIEIQTMSNKPGEFNFYSFSPDEGTWVEESKTALEAATTENQAGIQPPGPSDLPTADVDKVRPIKPRKASKTDLVFDLNIDNMENFDLDEWGSLMWQFANPMDGKDGKSNWLFDQKWSNVTITSLNPSTGECQITARKNANSRQKTKAIEKTAKVVPVLYGNDYKKALARYQSLSKEYESAIRKVENEWKSKSAQQKFIRAVQVESMGVYNWDRIIKQPGILTFNADFEFEGEYQDEALPVVYMIRGGTNEVITFYQRTEGNFAYNPKVNNTLVALLPNNEVATLATDDISDDAIIKAKRSNEISLSLKPTGVKVTNMNDLSEFLANNS